MLPIPGGFSWRSLLLPASVRMLSLFVKSGNPLRRASLAPIAPRTFPILDVGVGFWVFSHDFDGHITHLPLPGAGFECLFHLTLSMERNFAEVVAAAVRSPAVEDDAHAHPADRAPLLQAINDFPLRHTARRGGQNAFPSRTL